MIKNKWGYTTWGIRDEKKNRTDAITIDFRPVHPKADLKDDKSLIRINCTDRYTLDEYKEIAKIIIDRLNAWEVQKDLS